MKKIYLLILFSSFFIFYSCHDNAITIEDEIENDVNVYELSDNEVAAVLGDYIKGLSQHALITRNIGNPIIKGIRKKYYNLLTRSIDSVESGFTICNVDLQIGNEDGFAIVVADKRLPIVFAYSPHGKYEDINQSQNEMLIRYVENIPSSVAEILQQPRYLQASVYSNYKYPYAAFPYYSKRDDVSQYVDNQGCRHDYAYLSEIVMWGQGHPYNKYCPISTEEPDEHQVVGCVAIALTNVMAYYKYPANYNWNIMTAVKNVEYNDFAPIGAEDTIALFLREVADVLNTDYGDKASSATIPDCMSALNHYQYLYDSPIDYNLGAVETSIKNKNPILAFGQDLSKQKAHAFVIRGYWDIKVTEKMKSDTTYFYDDGTSIGVTWGNAGGWGDGWYLVKWGTMNIEQLHLMKYDPYTETSNGIDYSQKLQLITGVRPKE